MSSPKIKYQQIKYSISSIGQEISIDAETDKLYKKVTGINIVLSDARNKFSTIELDVNSNELFPENFEVLRLLFREQVPFGYDYHTLNEQAAGSKLKGKYKDLNNGANYPYNLIISLRLENE
jgi:hypothetical protein